MPVKDELVEIPKTMHKYFGGSGQMVKPTSATVESLVKKVPRGKVATLDSLREHLAKKYSVHTSCPAATLKALVQVSNSNPECGYWRIVKKKGELLAKLNGGIEQQAALLEKEGLTIDKTKTIQGVIELDDCLYKFK